MQPAFDPVIGLCDKMKAEGVTVKGLAISGEGSVMGDSPVLQDKAYFEVTLVEPGSWSVGVATRETPLEGLLSQEKSPTAWTLTSSGSVALGPGEVLGVAFDQGDYPVQLYFYKKGRQVHQLSGVRGEVLPVFSVADGAVLEPNFGGNPYAERVPSGYPGIIKSMSLLCERARLYRDGRPRARRAQGAPAAPRTPSMSMPKPGSGRWRPHLLE